MKHKIAFICTVLALLLGAFTQTGMAQSEKVAGDSDTARDLEPLNFKITLSKKDFLARATQYKEEPLNDKQLAYSVYLPSDWQKVADDKLENYEFSKRLLGEVAKYVSPPMGDDRAVFLIQALKMEVFMNIEHWFRNYMSVNGLYIDGIKVFSNDLVHAEYNVFQGSRSYTIRAVIQRNGSRVIISEYKVPIGVMNEKNNQRWVMTLFRLSNPATNLLEIAENYAYLDIASHLYPKDWGAVAGDYDSVNDIFATFGRRLVFKKARKRDDLHFLARSKGLIETSLISKSSFPNVQHKIAAILDKYKGVEFDMVNYETLNRRKGRKDMSVAYTPIKVYRTVQDDIGVVGYERWVSYNETADSYFIVTMLMPPQKFNYTLWAENVATYSLVLDSFTVNK